MEKRLKVYKVKAKIESGWLLAVLGSKTCLAYILIRNVVIKTLFIKLYESKNLLILEGVIKSIGIRLLNDVVVTENFIGEGVSLDLLEIDDIGLLEPTTLEALRPFRFLEPLIPGPFRPLEPVSELSRLSEEFIEPVDSSNLVEM